RFAPDAGHEIVLVKKPWFFGYGGIEPSPVTAGATFGAITTNGIDVFMRFLARMRPTKTSDAYSLGRNSQLRQQNSRSLRALRADSIGKRSAWSYPVRVCVLAGHLI